MHINDRLLIKILTYSRVFLRRTGHYRDELSMLRNIWVLLSKIAALPTKEGEDNSVSAGYGNELDFSHDNTECSH
jgi:hypothetical protein